MAFLAQAGLGAHLPASGAVKLDPRPCWGWSTFGVYQKYQRTVQESVLINFTPLIRCLVVGRSLYPACHFTKVVGQSSASFAIQTTVSIGRFISSSVKFTSKGEICGGNVRWIVSKHVWLEVCSQSAFVLRADLLFLLFSCLIHPFSVRGLLCHLVKGCLLGSALNSPLLQSLV